MSLYLAALFVAFTPGVLVSLPPKGGKYVVLAVHAVLFVLVWQYTNRFVWRMSIDGFQNNYNNSGNNAVVNNSGNNYNNSGNNGVVNNSGNNAMNNSGNNVVNNNRMNNSA